jgi:hypothetical protein
MVISNEMRCLKLILHSGVAALALPGGVWGSVRAMELPYGRLVKIRSEASVEEFADALSRCASTFFAWYELIMRGRLI